VEARLCEQGVVAPLKLARARGVGHALRPPRCSAISVAAYAANQVKKTVFLRRTCRQETRIAVLAGQHPGCEGRAELSADARERLRSARSRTRTIAGWRGAAFEGRQKTRIGQTKKGAESTLLRREDYGDLEGGGVGIR